MSDHKRKLAWAAVIVASATAISRLVGLGREVITAGRLRRRPPTTTPSSRSRWSRNSSGSSSPTPPSAPRSSPSSRRCSPPGTSSAPTSSPRNLLGFMLVVVGAVVRRAHRSPPTPVVQTIYPELTGHEPTRRSSPRSYLQILVPTVLVLALAGVITGVLYSLRALHHAGRGLHRLEPVDHRLHASLFARRAGRRTPSPGACWSARVRRARPAGRSPCARPASAGSRPSFHFGDPLLRRVLLLMVPITITLGILNFNALIDT